MEKNVKEEVKVIKGEGNDKPTVEERMIIKELEDKIKGMKEDKEKKCKAAKEQLIDMLEVTMDKYRTATGTAEALRVLRFVFGEEPVEVETAQAMTLHMLDTVNAMIVKAKSLSYAKMDQLCDGFYDKDFSHAQSSIGDLRFDLALEMMKIDLCRNVGGAAEDMVEFIKRVEDEIDATGEKLKEMKSKENK